MMTWRPRAVAPRRITGLVSADVFIYGIRKEVSPLSNPTKKKKKKKKKENKEMGGGRREGRGKGGGGKSYFECQRGEHPIPN